MNDPILEDLHATRERMLAESGGTLDGLVSRLQKNNLLRSVQFGSHDEPSIASKSPTSHFLQEALLRRLDEFSQL